MYDKYSKEVSSVGVVNFKLEMKKISTAMEEWWMNVYSHYPKYYEVVSIIYQILTMYWRESRVYITISSLMILLVHSLYLRPLYQLIKSNLILILNYFLLQVCFILWFFLSIRIILMLFNLVRWRKSVLFSKYPLFLSDEYCIAPSKRFEWISIFIIYKILF